MSIILSHPTGNANVRAAAEGLATAGELYRFYTTLATTPHSFLAKLGTVGPLSEIKRRSYSTTLAPYIQLFPWYELGRMLSGKLGMSKLQQHETGPFSVDAVYRTLDRHVSRQLKKAANHGVKGIYQYEDGALQSFEAAKSLGLTCLYDLPIGYWRAMHRLLKIEQAIHPDWAATLTGFNDSAEKLAHKDKELANADHLFVASSFTAATLKDYPGKLAPVSVIPYGFPTPNLNRSYRSLQNGPLKILFVGGLSQRKGIANLFEAAESFGNKVELTIVGNKAVQDCAPLNAALARHRWIPSLPHAAVLQLMQQQDVFIFPSLFEGFGLVITEAMSQGTPVITTERTAGPDIITHGENGWLVEAGNTESLQIQIAAILAHPEQVQSVGRAAIETAAKRPWKVYSEELVEAITTVK